jgi:hypothetical protein
VGIDVVALRRNRYWDSSNQELGTFVFSSSLGLMDNFQLVFGEQSHWHLAQTGGVSVSLGAFVAKVQMRAGVGRAFQ